MVDTPSSILLLRLQSLGSNTNLWGGYLNVAMQMLEQAAKGYQTSALTVDVTITWANYTAGNVGACAVLKLTGTLASAVTMTLPAYMNSLMIWNNAGAQVTTKCSGGTGVAIPNGRKAWVFCDGVDYYSASPTWFGETVTLTNNGDLVTYAQVSALIAAATTITSPGTVKVSASDTTASFLNAAFTTGQDVESAIANPAADETVSLSLSTARRAQLSGLAGKRTDVAAGTTAATVFNRYRITGAATVTLPTFAADEWIIVEYGATSGTTMTVGRNAQTINGTAANNTGTTKGPIIVYFCTSVGVVVSKLIGRIPA